MPIAAIVGLAALLLALRALLHIPRRQFLVIAAFIGWAAVMAIIGAVSSFPLLGRHISFALPPLVALIALGVNGAGRRIPSLMAVATASLALSSLAGFWWVDAYQKEDLREAASIARQCTPIDVVWAAGRNAAVYYLPEVPVRWLPVEQAPDLPASNQPDPTLFILNRAHYDPHGDISDALAASRPGYHIKSLPGLYLVGPQDCIEDP